MSAILGVGVMLLLVAIFGVLMARFALRHGALGPSAPEPKPTDPYALVWWQDLQDLGYEYHFANGEVWRGRIDMRRYPDGAAYDDVLPHHRWDLFRTLRQRIEWGEPEIMALHGHTLVDWSPMERAYQLKLLNGTLWQFNTKSEGLGENNEMAWHLKSYPEGSVSEAMVRVHASLNAHLEQIRASQARATVAANSHGTSAGAQHVSGCRVCGTPNNLLLGVLGNSTGNHLLCVRCAKGQVLNARF